MIDRSRGLLSRQYSGDNELLKKNKIVIFNRMVQRDVVPYGACSLIRGKLPFLFVVGTFRTVYSFCEVVPRSIVCDFPMMLAARGTMWCCIWNRISGYVQPQIAPHSLRKKHSMSPSRCVIQVYITYHVLVV